MTTTRRHAFHDGRDEMNLADFPISALQRQQPTEADGRKVDRLEFDATRYDPVGRRRVQQKVTLTSTARDGLPTPADEHVILALLFVAKHSHNFAEPTVRFAPSQLFEIMGWATNGRSYVRLRDVLRRLKALTIRYENAWWDAAGRGYEEEVATGIVAAYRIARQLSGPRTATTQLQSWVTWSPQFQDSLSNGNLKRLDLEVFFQLRTPTAQRIYRFLDKRFYNSPTLALDLIEFACGHIGLTETNNVALLKRRLAPALAELEGIGFIVPAAVEERYQKVQAGVWRVHFQSAEAARAQSETPRLPAPAPSADAQALAREFYRLWDPAAPAHPGPRDLEQAAALLHDCDAAEANALMAALVEVTKRAWPECRSFSGAMQKYLADAVRLQRQRQQREERRRAADVTRQRQHEEDRARREREQERLAAWQALPDAEREAIRRRVLDRLGGLQAPEPFVRHLCLEEMVHTSRPPEAGG